MEETNKYQISVDPDVVVYIDDLALTFHQQPLLAYMHSCVEHYRNELKEMRAKHTMMLKTLYETDMDDESKKKCNELLAALLAFERETATKRRNLVYQPIRAHGSKAQLYLDMADLKCEFVPYSGVCSKCSKPIERVCVFYKGNPVHIKKCTYD